MNFTMDKQKVCEMYRKMYWNVIFSKTAAIKARWLAVRSLWIMRKWQR
jgi:hypothetical protein